MTDQHTPSQRQSAAPASTAVPGEDGMDTPARPSRSRATKPTAASPARPAAKAARAAPRTATPDEAAAETATSPSSAAMPGTDAAPSPAAASTPAARPRAAVKPPAQPRAAAQEATALPPDSAGSPPSPEAGTKAEAARPSRRAAPVALPEPSEAAPAPEPDLPRGAATSPDPVEENAPEAAAALADGSEPDPADPEAANLEAGDLEASDLVEAGDLEASEPDAPAAREDEEDDEEEEEAPRSNARMPGMGGGMARPGMRPISPQLGGRPTPAPRIPSKAENFVEGDHVVYPTHGVGRVERIATEEIAGHKLELIHITFEENRMTLRVPVAKARSAGLRKLATRKMFDEALTVLRGRARIKRTMWSRRAQEYEAKINSGDPLSIAEVVRDLHRNAGQPDQSFSERQIYEAAMDRLAAELAALDQTEKTVAATKLVDYLKTV